MTSVKRNLFTTPSRVKRQKTMGTMTRKSAPMKIPKSLLPETKQIFRNLIATSDTDYAIESIPSFMNQGDGSDQFVGSKVRIQRVRVTYDFSGLSLTTGHRIMLVIPKDPSNFVTPVTSNIWHQIDTDQFTVLHDQIMSNDSSLRAGTFDWVGPLNVETNKNGTTPLRNNLTLVVFSDGQGANIRTRVGYSVWFTDN